MIHHESVLFTSLAVVRRASFSFGVVIVSLSLLSFVASWAAVAFPALAFMNGQCPLVSLYLKVMKPMITAIQYTLYDMTDP